MKAYLDKMRQNVDLSVIAVLFTVIFAAMSVLHDKFLTLNNFQSVMLQLPGLGLLVLAMLVPMVTGGINLSIIASTNLTSILMASIMVSGVGGVGGTANILLAVGAGLALSVILGLTNGVIISVFKITPIIATLCTKLLFEGVSTMITKGYIVSGLPPEFLALGHVGIWHIPVMFVVFLAAAIALALLLNRHALGRQIYLYGSNPVATRFSGVNEIGLILKTYAISNLLAGVAAVLLLARLNSASVGYSNAYLLMTVLICVLGGVNPNGGKGKVFIVFLALIVLQMISNGFTFMGMSQYLATAIWGILLLVVIAVRAVRLAKHT